MFDLLKRKTSTYLLLGLWGLLVVALFLAGAASEYSATLESARIEVRAYYKSIVTFRHWVAGHGGVYAPRTIETPSNPYLKHIPEREVITPSGKVLTLINPAYATRQIHEALQKTSHVRGHLTSLNPIRKENAADPWETMALTAFENGAQEISELSLVDGTTHMRLMKPLVVQKSCMQCHEVQGYKVGEIRGGLSVSVPMSPHYTEMQGNLIWTGLGYGVLWLIGSIAIVVAVQRLDKRQQERDEANALLKSSERRFRNLAESAPVGIFRMNEAGKLLFANSALMRMMDITEDEITKTFMFDKIHIDDKQKIMADWQEVQTTRQVLSDEFRFCTNTGKETWVYGIVIPEQDDNNQNLYIGTIIDISERKIAEKKIHQLAYSDAATGMPNETYFLEQLNEKINNGAQGDGCQGFVASVLLSGISDVVGTFGLEAAELIYYKTSQRLMKAMPENCTAARVGPRLFKILYITDTLDEVQTMDIINTLFALVQAPFDLMGNKVVINVRMGVSFIDPDTSTAKSVLTNVEIAHHEAKGSVGNSLVYFDESIKQLMMRNTQIVSWLHSAIANGAFQLFYQPQIDLKSNTIIGCEALIRWPQESGDWISPMEFIPISEQSGTIGDITKWTVGEACRTAASWISEHDLRLRTSVNISAEVLVSDELYGYVLKFIDETGLPPELLEIEITETALMKNIEVASRNLEQLRKMGATVAIDDFGTGHSSLAYLKSFPIDRLKIDQSFVKNAPHDKADQDIIVSIITLAHSLGMDVIAEGAEEKEHMDLLLSLGCDEVQGYYVSRPIPADQFVTFVKAWKP